MEFIYFSLKILTSVLQKPTAMKKIIEQSRKCPCPLYRLENLLMMKLRTVDEKKWFVQHKDKSRGFVSCFLTESWSGIKMQGTQEQRHAQPLYALVW